MNTKTKIALIITAGGTSARFGRNKLLEKVNGKELILYTIDAFKNIEVTETVITVSEDLKKFLTPIARQTNIKLVDGGKTRQESVFNGLKALDKKTEFVIIHDGARPLVKTETILNCLKTAQRTKAAIAAVKAIDTIKIVENSGLIISTPKRETLRCVQTPQIFDYKLIFEAHKKLEGQNFSDDAGMLEHLGYKVYTTEGDYTNIKITTPNDIITFNSYL